MISRLWRLPAQNCTHTHIYLNIFISAADSLCRRRVLFIGRALVGLLQSIGDAWPHAVERHGELRVSIALTRKRRVYGAKRSPMSHGKTPLAMERACFKRARPPPVLSLSELLPCMSFSSRRSHIYRVPLWYHDTLEPERRFSSVLHD